MHVRSFLLVGLWLLPCLAAAQAAAFRLRPGMELPLHRRLYVWHDPAGTATLADVAGRHRAAFAESPSAVPNFGRQAGVRWARFAVRADTPGEWLLEVDFPFVDDIRVALVDDGGRVIYRARSGWAVPPGRRAFMHRNHVFVLPLRAGVPCTVYVRAVNGFGLLKFPFTLWDGRTFRRTTDAHSLAWGFFAGVLGFLSLFGLLLGAALRDRTYVYFSAYMLCSAGMLGVLEGWAAYLLAGGTPWLAGSQARPLFLILTMLALLRFTQEYLGVRAAAHPRAHRLMRALAWAVAVFLAAVFLHLLDAVPLAWRLRATNTLVLALVAAVVGLVVRRIQSGYGPARFYLLSLGPFVAIGTGQMAMSYNLLPHHAVFFEGLPFAVLVQVAVLCAGLAYRFRLYKKESERLLLQVAREQQLTYEARLAANEQEARRLKEELHGLEMHAAHQAERERIARDLHDNVGSQLTFIISNLDYIAHQSTRDDSQHLLAPSLEEVGQHARETMHLLRDTLWAVHKESITTGELAKRLQAYVGQHFRDGGATPGCQVRLRLQHDRLLKPGHALNLFRIVQEAVTNSLKHAQAGMIQLYISLTAQDEFIVQIADDGVGFAAAGPADGYGLANMRRRAESIGAAFEMQSAAGLGTTVTVRLAL